MPSWPSGRAPSRTGRALGSSSSARCSPAPSAAFVPSVTATKLSWPSPSPVCEVFVWMSTPSKSSLRMKFSAPEIASEPYTAEAPPVMMSMRSIERVGIIDVSTSPSSLNGTMRLPFISIRLRCEPRPRRSIVAAPCVPLLTFWPSLGTVIGRRRRIFSTSGSCWRWISSSLMRVDRARRHDAGLSDARAGDDDLVLRRLEGGSCAYAGKPVAATAAPVIRAQRTAPRTESWLDMDARRL